jgi:glucan 1,3-beta-glucosidase
VSLNRDKMFELKHGRPAPHKAETAARTRRAWLICAACSCTVCLVLLIVALAGGSSPRECARLMPGLEAALASGNVRQLREFRTCVLSDPLGVQDPRATEWATRHRSLRGVNLGGWLLMERWLMGGSPTVETACCGAVEAPYNGTECLEADSELAITRLLRERGELDKIDRYRDQFITEKDFEAMAGAGLNAVRVPIGYWIVDPTAVPEHDYHGGAGLRYLDDAVAWAERHGLQLFFQLHGAPGGQSMQQTTGFLNRAWTAASFDKVASVAVLATPASRYASSEAVIAIGLLNEPELPSQLLLEYYEAAIPAIREAGMSAERVAIVLNLYSDAGIAAVFTDAWPLFNDRLTPARGFENLIYDIHLYYAFLPEGLTDKVSIESVTNDLVAIQSKVLQLTGRPCLTGEWSVRVPHPGTAAGQAFIKLQPSEQFSTLKQFATNQVQAISVTRPTDLYPRTGGFYWTWTGPGHSTIGGRGCVSGDQTQWSSRTALEEGWIAEGEWAT